MPKYDRNNLVADGDPALAFGPQPTAGGGFSYANGSRLYYASLASARPGTAPFKGFEAIAVSHTDNPQASAAGGAAGAAAWSDPVIASRQNSSLFSDKEQIWARRSPASTRASPRSRRSRPPSSRSARSRSATRTSTAGRGPTRRRRSGGEGALARRPLRRG